MHEHVETHASFAMERVLPDSNKPTMPLQRRYSVTGQTPPDDVGTVTVKSPKLQALDTSVQTASCNVCEAGDADQLGHADHTMLWQPDHTTHSPPARTSSKRSATQLPSPITPSSLELPTKIARLGLHHHHDIESVFSDEDASDSCPEESDLALSACGGDSPPYSFTSESDFDCPSEAEDTQRTPQDILKNGITWVDTDAALTFCTLPPELRHQIYLNLPDLVLPYPLIYCLSTFEKKKQHPLASVSRLIRSEALAIFYSYNTWIIKLEYSMMYDAFLNWMSRLGEGAGSLRLIKLAVRGTKFKPRLCRSSIMLPNPLVLTMNGHPVNPVVPVEEYHPPDGDASFDIDLSEKHTGGKVVLVRNDGRKDAGEQAKVYLAKLVEGLWQKKRMGTLNGQDWITMVDRFLVYIR